MIDAIKDVRGLVNETTNIEAKTLLLRDLVEICWTGQDAACTQEAEIEAFGYANANEKLRFLIPELYAYLISLQVWFNNTDFLDKFIETGGVSKFTNPAANPIASAHANLALHAYFIRKNDRQAAETAYSSAVLSLLMLDSKNKYGMAKLLVELLEALISQQDIVGAGALVATAETFLQSNLAHTGPYYARYRLLVAQLLAFANVHAAAAAALSEASKLVERQRINEDIRTYRLAANNSLASLALILAGNLPEAIEMHSHHPMHNKRDEILRRGEFQTYQELYFALSDTILKSFDRQTSAKDWKSIFEKPTKWQTGKLEEQNVDSYRIFALGLIAAPDSISDARALYQKSGWQRINGFESVLKGRFEGFQLPSSVDLLILGAALSSTARDTDSQDYDLLLKGSEILSRTLRHQLSDFAVLIGSQKTDGSQNRARSYKLLIQQKRNWEMEQIAELLADHPLNRGAIVNSYTELVKSTSRLKESFSQDPEYVEVAGYPTLAQMQDALHPNEIFITYIPTFEGLGRLCITKTAAFKVLKPYAQDQVRSDIKLLQFSLTADHAANASLDAQFPVEAAVRLKEALFGGLDSCMKPGSHINIALPEDVLGIPMGVLLGKTPKVLGNGYDLARADWLADSFSFSVTVSARHFLGTRNLISKQPSQLTYLGIGDPTLSHKDIAMNSPARASVSLSALPALPETAQELTTVGHLLEAKKPDILLGNSATEEAFRSKSLGSYDVIHFATHGLLKGELTGLPEPALVLTPNDPTDSFDNGLLSASEISRFSMKARLVVLSACNSAKFDTSALSAGATDLQSAFSVAGAPTLLATLWTIDSASARDIMIEFFKAWKAQGDKSASKALSVATRAYRKRADRAHQHPRFWGPFVVYGYGYDLPRQTLEPDRLEHSFEAFPGSDAGEVIDAKPMGSDVFLSSIGGWNGEKMAGIVTRISETLSRRWVSRSYEIGAGNVLVGDRFALALGYTSNSSPAPVLTRFGLDGRIVWRKEFQDFSELNFVNGIATDGEIVLLADSFLPTPSGWRQTIVVRLGEDGAVLSKTAVETEKANLLIGERAFLAADREELALAVVSQSESKLDVGRSGIFGLAPWCPGRVQTAVRLMATRTLEARINLKIEDFQAHWMGYVNGLLLIGGDSRERCSQIGAASIYRVNGDGSSTLLWIDNDQFASAVQSIYQDRDKLSILVRRSRPVGVRTMVASETLGGSKRWGDNDNTLTEYSILNLDKTGVANVAYSSSFGISSFPRGTVYHKGKHFIFGSLGGRPAISRDLISLAR